MNWCGVTERAKPRNVIVNIRLDKTWRAHTHTPLITFICNSWCLDAIKRSFILIRPIKINSFLLCISFDFVLFTEWCEWIWSFCTLFKRQQVHNHVDMTHHKNGIIRMMEMKERETRTKNCMMLAIVWFISKEKITHAHTLGLYQSLCVCQEQRDDIWTDLS